MATSSGTGCVASSVNETHRVVVAEDDPLVAGALSWLLREQGYLVETAETRDDLAARVAVAHAVAQQILACDAEIDAARAELGGDLRGRQERHLDIAAAGNARTVSALVGRQLDAQDERLNLLRRRFDRREIGEVRALDQPGDRRAMLRDRIIERIGRDDEPGRHREPRAAEQEQVPRLAAHAITMHLVRRSAGRNQDRLRFHKTSSRNARPCPTHTNTKAITIARSTQPRNVSA